MATRLVLLCLVLAVVAPGARAQGVTLDAERVDVVHGRALVVPVKVADRRSAERPVLIKLEDTRRVEGRVYWLSPVDEPPQNPHAWVVPSPPWRAWSGRAAWQKSQSDDPDAIPGRWYLVAELPFDAVGQGIWLDGERHAVQWLPDPHRLADTDGPAWSSPLPAGALDDPIVRAAVGAQRASPLTAWRARLIDGSFAPGGPLGDDQGEGGPVQSFEALRAELARGEEEPGAVATLADWMTSRWQLALAWVHRGDPITARRLRAALGGVVETPTGWAPAFVSDQGSLNELLTDLLNPFVDAPTRALRAEAWLGTEPGGVAWVIDDAGRAPEGQLAVTVGIVNLTDRSIAARTEPPRRSPVFQELAPRLADSMVVSIDATDGGPTGRLSTARVPVAVGRWNSGVEPIESVLSAHPPGVRAGPLLHQWTMDAWLTGRLGLGALPAKGDGCAALLYRSGGATADDRAGWRLLIECETRPMTEGTSASDDVVRVWLGAFGFASSVIEVSRNGNVRTRDDGPPPVVRLAQRANGWTADIALPRDSVGADGVLRIGLERVDARGIRTSWPRRMLPWQTEPGRLAFDLTDWDGLGR